MRNLKIALLAVGTIISLLSLRDDGMVTTSPDTKPLVAEAYHSPQDTRLPPLTTEHLVVPLPSVRIQPQVLIGSPSVDSTEYDSLGQNRDAGTNEPVNLANANTASPAPIGKPATNSDLPAATPPTTIIYGMASIESPSSTNDNNASGVGSGISGSGISSNNSSGAGGASPSLQSNTNNVLITNLAPNSGIPGTNIIIQGAGFDSAAPNNIVKFGSISAASVSYVSKNQLRATIPQGLSSGFTNLSVSVNGAASNSFLFDILKDISGNVFIDDTQNILPAGIALTDSSIIRLGDVDNDSDLDLFVVDTSDGSAHLFVNNGQGNFTDETSSRLPAIVNPSFINDAVFGDLNKDGYVDIILAYSSGQSVRLLLNDGRGNFNDVTLTNLPNVSGNAVSMDLGDSNGDGMPDIIIANNNVRDILLVNGGAGLFTIDTNFNLPAIIDGSSDIRFCDVNGDGNLDIITTNNEVVGASSLRNRVYINDGQGQFTDATESILPDDNEYSEVLDCGDIDNDGNIDVIAANYNQNAALINSGNGTFTDQTSQRIPTNDFASKDTKLGDINGDGYLDIVILGEDKMSLLLNDGQGSFSEDSIKLPDYKSTPALLGGKNVQVADINGDGCLDIIVGGGVFRILMNTAANKPPVLDHIGNKTIESGESLTFNVTAQDPNGDALMFLAGNLPNGATFLSKIFRWTPASSDIGQHANIRFIAKEDTQFALEGSEDITILVTGSDSPIIDPPDNFDTQTNTNNSPIIDSYSPLEAIFDLTVGNSQAFSITASDQDTGDTLTYNWSVNGSPAGANSNSYGYSASQAGQFTVKVTVSDGKVTTPPEHIWTVNVNPYDIQQILNDIINRAFNYFWRETDNPATGFVRDRLLVNGDPAADSNYEKASMAATGFGLSAMCVAAKKYGDGSDPDWQVSPEDLAARVELILDTLLRIQSNQSPGGDATWGKSGFFYHFVNINTGENWPNVEVSSIDTAILIAGALTAGEYFKDVNPNVSSKANQLYANVDWNSFVDYTSNDHYGQFYKQWMPGAQGHNNGHWDYNDESTLLYLLAIGSPVPEYAVNPDLYYSMRRELGSYGADGKAIVRTWFGSLFAYQYTNAFFDLRNMHDARNVDWWQNAVHATIANRQFCIDQDNAGDYGYNQNVWGLSSSYSIGATYVGEYGAPPTGNPNGPTHDGTVNPSVVASAISMLTSEVGETLASMKSDPNLWHQDSYGFVDSFKNSDPRIYSDYFVGLDLGVSLVMLANHTDSGLIWNNFMNAQTRYGTMRDLLTQLNFHSNSDSKLYIDVDDITPKSQFAYGSIDSANTASQVSFNLIDIVPNSKYILAIHTFMNNFAGDYQVILNVSANGNDEGNQAISHVTDKSDDIKYIEVDSSHLQPGENVITLTWQSGASWIAWKNLEISSPITNNEWTITRSLSATEYRLDDTYYTGHADKYGAIAYKTFEQALNSAADPYTDILFYIDDLDHDRKLTLTPHDSNGVVYVNITVNGQLSSENTLINGQQQQVIIPANLLKAGWNRVRLTMTDQGGEWLIWDRLKLELGDLATIEAPQGFVAASFGKNTSKLRWNSAPFAAKYNLYRSMTKGGPYTIVDEVNPPAASYTDTGLLDNTVYYYVVRAVKADGAESQDSQEAAVTTGSYQLDYGDGHSPNVFGQGTFDNAGSSLGDNAFTQIARYNGLPGKVRIFNVASSQKNTIGLNNANINDATIFSFRVKGETGGEKFQIKLKDNAGAEASVSLEIPSGAIWQEMHFNMADTFSGIDLTNMQSMEVVSQTTLGQITFYFDEVEFATVGLTGDKLDVKIRNGANDGLATGVDFGATTAENGPVLSNQYIEIGYASSGSWGIQIFTDNKAEDARPRFTGIGDRANGLVGMTDSGYRVPVLWQVWQEKKGYYNGTETPEFDTTIDDGDRAEFAFIMDKSDSDWSVPYARNYRTLMDHNGLLGAPVPLAVPPPGYWPRLGNTGQPIYIYLAADFTGVPAQQYTTNKLIIDIYHE